MGSAAALLGVQGAGKPAKAICAAQGTPLLTLVASPSSLPLIASTRHSASSSLRPLRAIGAAPLRPPLADRGADQEIKGTYTSSRAAGLHVHLHMASPAGPGVGAGWGGAAWCT